MIDRNEIIEDNCTPDEWAQFETRVEMLHADDLKAIADRLRLRIQDDEPWQTYRDEFSHETWRDFTESYEHVTRANY